MATARPSPTARSATTSGVLAALCALVLVSCAAPEPPPPSPTAALSAPAPAATARTMAEPEPTSSGEPENLITGSPDEFSRVGSLVSDFPIDLLPVPGDAVLLVTSSVPVGDSTVREVSLNLRTSATADQILELYRDSLTVAGFTEVPPTTPQSDLAAETTFIRSGGSELVSIGVLERDGARTVAIGGQVETAAP